MEFRLLGSLEIHAAGSVLSPKGARQRSVLAALLLGANEIVTVPRLVEAAWAEPPRSAAANVRTHVAALRRLLAGTGRDGGDEPRLHTSPSGYRLVVSPGECDLTVFERLVGQGEELLEQGNPQAAKERLQQGQELWRGRALENVPLGPALQPEVARLEEQRLVCVQRCLDARLAMDDNAGVAAAVRGLVEAHPLRERFWEQLMLALYRSERQADALAAYTEVRKLLVEELGVEPGPGLQRLEQQILRVDPTLELSGTDGRAAVAGVTPVPGAPHQLPPALATFVGREVELTWLRERLAAGTQPEPALVALDGMGGVGKSVLAIRAAHDLCESFPDGRLYVDLQGASPGLAPLEPIEVLEWFLRALGVDAASIPTEVGEAGDRFRALAAGRRLLVVLDNATAAAQVRPLLPTEPGCAALVTSRQALVGLDGAAHRHLDTLAPSHAVALLAHVAGAQRLAAEPEAAARLARLCGYLPLALRIAGARLAARPDWPVYALADRLEDEQTRLDELAVADIAARASFQISYHALRGSDELSDRATARAFRRLGLLDGPDVGLGAAAALLDLDGNQTHRLLERLVDARLLTSSQPNRYSMHDLLRLFAKEQSRNEETEAERQACLQRVLDHYLATAQRARQLSGVASIPRLRGEPDASGVELASHTEALDWLETERSSLVAAIVQATTDSDTNAQTAVWLAEAMFWFLNTHACFHDLETVNDAALHAVRGLGDHVGHGCALAALAAVHHQHHNYFRAASYLEQALHIHQKHGSYEHTQLTLGRIGIVYVTSGRVEEGLACQQQRLRITREQGDKRGESATLNNIGHTYRAINNLTLAADYCQQSLAVGNELDEPILRVPVLTNLGVIHAQHGHLHQARAYLDDCLAHSHQTQYRSEERYLRIFLSQVYRLLGDSATALVHCDRNLTLCRDIGDYYYEGLTLRERGTVLRTLGHPESARQCWQEALDVFRSLDAPESAELRQALCSQHCPAPPAIWDLDM